MIKVKFSELRAPLFLNGRNFGTKLDYTKPQLSMLYNREEKELYVFYGDQMAMIPRESCASIVPVDMQDFGVKAPAPEVKKQQVVKPQAATPPVKAQVGGPGDVVRSAQVWNPITEPPKKPGRPSKFQGGDNQGE
jgi:hypothetical protein